MLALKRPEGRSCRVVRFSLNATQTQPFILNMNSAAHYTVTRTSHGFALTLEHGDGEATLVDYFPTKAEAVETRNALLTLRAGRR